MVEVDREEGAASITAGVDVTRVVTVEMGEGTGFLVVPKIDATWPMLSTMKED